MKTVLLGVFTAAALMVSPALSSAFAAEAKLPIRAQIVQCGPRAELEKACMRDERCCGFLPQVSVATTESAPQPLKSASAQPIHPSNTHNR